MLIHFMESGEEGTVCNLVEKVFNEFVALDYSKRGIEEFREYVNAEKLRERAENNHFTLVAKEKNTIVGMIEVRRKDHLSLLFVDQRFQRRGTAKQLITRAIEICRANDSGVFELEVNSSPYAVGIYEKIGFEKTGDERERNGIRFTPMVLKLD